LEDLGKLITYCHKKGFLTCLYTGRTGVYDAIVASNQTLDYIKVGRYMKEMGPLDNPNTNQKFYRIHYLKRKNSDDNGWTLEDITYKFRHNENKD
jgi:anaerobic ribonucleoside-triphosphate reductase activating protein